MQIVVNGLLTNYEIAGSGPSVLMLHGWGDSLRTFDKLVPEFTEKYQIIRLDMPGFGASEAPKDVWNLDNYASFTNEFLAKVGAKDIRAVIAHSNGGALAINGLGNGQLKAEKLVLISSSGIRNQQKVRRLGLKVIAKAGKVMTFWLPDSQKQKLRKKLYGVAGSDMLVAPHLQETFKQTVRQDIQTYASKLEIPTLLIYGSEDKATPPAYGKMFKDLIQDSRLEIIEGAEHFIHQDKPKEVTSLVKGFIA